MGNSTQSSVHADRCIALDKVRPRILFSGSQQRGTGGDAVDPVVHNAHMIGLVPVYRDFISSIQVLESAPVFLIVPFRNTKPIKVIFPSSTTILPRSPVISKRLVPGASLVEVMNTRWLRSRTHICRHIIFHFYVVHPAEAHKCPDPHRHAAYPLPQIQLMGA